MSPHYNWILQLEVTRVLSIRTDDFVSRISLSPFRYESVGKTADQWLFRKERGTQRSPLHRIWVVFLVLRVSCRWSALLLKIPSHWRYSEIWQISWWTIVCCTRCPLNLWYWCPKASVGFESTLSNLCPPTNDKPTILLTLKFESVNCLELEVSSSEMSQYFPLFD